MTVNVIKANVVQQMDYYPFGLMWEAQDATQTNNLLWHHGKELQEGEFLQQGVSFDLEDFGARMYDPVVARWWSVDPLASNAPNWSPYRAFFNNPLLFTDPDGQFEGDYYNENGDWIGNDGIDDGKVYHADKNGNVSFGEGILIESRFTEWNYEIKDPKLQEYFPELLSHEGGFINHPNDPGKATNRGITQAAFEKYARSLLGINPTLENLKHLSKSQAAAIYEKVYWEPSGATDISDKQLGWLHFDTYVHGGATNVLKNTLKYYGKNGSSISDLNIVLKQNKPIDVFNTYKTERRKRFDRLIAENPNLEDFRSGWYNRLNRFKYKIQ